MAKIEIERTKEFADSLRSYKVALNGEIVGKINNGETFSYELPSGMHSLRMRINWQGSNTEHFEVSDGEVVRFKCGHNMSDANAGLLYMTIWRNKYLWLQRS